MLARIAFFHRTVATKRPLASASVSSTRGAAFFLAYGANSVSNPLKISSRFQRLPKTSMNCAFCVKNSNNSSALCHFSPARKLSSLSLADGSCSVLTLTPPGPGVFAKRSRTATAVRPLACSKRAANDPSAPNNPSKNVLGSDMAMTESLSFFTS